MILYLHGFRSSPHSSKARLLAARMQTLGQDAAWRCPQLPASPHQAMACAMQLAREVAPHDLSVIGSSLGGYYATWLAEQLGCKAVLLNPAVNAARDLAGEVGTTTAYHSDAPFEFRSEYLQELQDFAVTAITQPQRYYLLAATGDTVLDWREMAAHFPGAQQRIIQGSDHGLSDFAEYLDDVLAFCGMNISGGP